MAMATTLTLTQEMVHRLAPDDGVFKAARGLKGKFKWPAVSADGTWLLAECQGSGKEPYQVSIDLADPSAPVSRCTCPSRKFPCKHGLGLMLLYAEAPDRFAEEEPPPELLAKRTKQAQRAQKKAAAPAAPRQVNQVALAKKAAAQRDGLDLLEKLLLDLVAVGQWYESSRLDRLERQAKQMNDAYLPGARVMLRRLVLLGEAEMAADERAARAAEVIGQLWATVQKGRNYLDGKLAGDEGQAEADAVLEEVLGKAWQLTELRALGYWRQGLTLLELAYERFQDQAREEQIEASHLLDLADGAIHCAVTYRPLNRLKYIPEQLSYTQPLVVAEAAVYPGFINRRVRWEKSAERVVPLEPGHLKTAHGLAAPALEPVLGAFRQQLKHPLAPGEAVVLVRCAKVGRVGDGIVLEDDRGARLEVCDRRPGSPNVANLIRAAGMLPRPAVLARLLVRPLQNTIVAEPLAALTETHHIRLGL
jgi:hypothetical protein